MSPFKNNLSTVKLTNMVIITSVIVLLGIVLGNMIFKRTNKALQQEPAPELSVKVSVINGCGYKGIAREVKQILVDKYNKNIDVIEWRNGKKFIWDKTVLVMVKNDTLKLNYMKDLTGIDRRLVALDDDAQEDVQIILGKDYHKYFKKE